MTQTINEVISAIKTLIASYFGGARISSGVRLSMFSGESIRTKYKKSTNWDKYICKVQNGKVFYRDKIHHISMKNPFIGMWDGSSKNKSITDIEQFWFFLILCLDIVSPKKTDNYHRYDLQKISLKWKRKGNSVIACKLESEIFSQNRNIFFCMTKSKNIERVIEDIAYLSEIKILKEKLRNKIQSDKKSNRKNKDICTHILYWGRISLTLNPRFIRSIGIDGRKFYNTRNSTFMSFFYRWFYYLPIFWFCFINRHIFIRVC